MGIENLEAGEKETRSFPYGVSVGEHLDADKREVFFSRYVTKQGLGAVRVAVPIDPIFEDNLPEGRLRFLGADEESLEAMRRSDCYFRALVIARPFIRDGFGEVVAA